MFTVDRSADTTDGSDAIFLVTGRTVTDGCRGLVTGFGEGAGAAFAFFGAVLAFEGFAAGLGFGFGAAAPCSESTPSMVGVPGSAEDVDERRLPRRSGATGVLPLKKPLRPVQAANFLRTARLMVTGLSRMLHVSAAGSHGGAGVTCESLQKQANNESGASGARPSPFFAFSIVGIILT